MKKFIVFVVLIFVVKNASAQFCDTTLWIPNGPVNSILLRDSLLYVGGTFSQVSPDVGHFVAVDSSTGSVVPPFPLVNGKIDCMTKDSVGRIYVGGLFSTVGQFACSNLFRLTPQGFFDPTFLPNPDGEVFSITFCFNTLFIGGDFSTIDGYARQRGAAFGKTVADSLLPFNADSLLPFDARSNGPIYSMYPDTMGHFIIVGGDFSSIGGSAVYPFNFNIAKLYLSSGDFVGVNVPWTATPRIDGPVRSIRMVGTRIYIGGDFTSFGTLQRKGFASLDLNTGNVTLQNAGLDGTVRDIETIGTQIYFGGNFSVVAGHTRHNLACIDTSLNVLPWNPSASGPVYDLSLWDSTAFCVGGNFNKLGNDSCYFAGIIDTSGFVHPIDPLFDAPVYAVMPATAGLKFWACGDFNGAAGVFRQNFATININTRRPNNWAPNFNNAVTTLYADSTQLFVAGNFSAAANQGRVGIASFDFAANSLTAFNPGVNGLVRTMTSENSKLYIGGNFSTVGNQTRNNIACIDIPTSQPTVWNPNCAGTVNKLILDGNHLYVGGFFTQVGGQFRQNLARVSTSTGLSDFGWSSDTDDGIYDMDFYNGQLYIGGWFQNVAGQPRTYFACVDSTSGSLLAFNPNLDNYIRTFVRWNGDFFLSGSFSVVNGNNIRPHLCNYDLGSSQFSSWSPSPNVFATTLQPSQNWLYIGGSFSSVAYHYHPNLAMISVNYVTGITENDSQKPELLVWPNPANDFVFVSVGENKMKTVEVMDVTGKILSEEKINATDGIFKIDFSNFVSGIYLIRVVDENGNARSEKVIKN